MTEVLICGAKRLAWVRAGAPRDARGRPVVEEKKRRGAA